MRAIRRKEGTLMDGTEDRQLLGLVRDLLAHSEWADATMFRVWERSLARDHEELRRRAGHMLDVRRAFLSMLGGGPPIFPPSGPLPTFGELRDQTAASHATLRRFAAGLDATAAAVRVWIPWFPDPPCVVSVIEGLVQVALHTQHHRGQFMTRLRDHGGQPENVDWIIWLWQRKPTADWMTTEPLSGPQNQGSALRTGTE
jgi:uncharacterized damage-inducible protein DinB